MPSQPKQQTTATSPARTLTHSDWIAEAKRRFGDDVGKWRFVCPACGHAQSVGEMKAAGMPESAAGFSCIGRWLDSPREAFGKGPGPCNYAGGGLFGLNPVTVRGEQGQTEVFEFAEGGAA